ncbi:MAG: nucleotidyl transferase AbiEii/AbiGii toxin family protein [Cyanobacteria bacterium]|nr:nucleotidyl transferase AbiEii/AbiGii toxin family protein [Cyanobacteriota bacterium]
MRQHQAEWHEEVLPAGWLSAAGELRRCGAADRFYLAGGTGLALQLGHRISVDLDLFTPRHFEPHKLRDSLRHAPGFRVEQIAEDTLHGAVDGVQLSFLHYPYALLFGPRQFKGLHVADVRDIACMKLDALAARGTRRDFIDLYAVLRRFTMPELLRWFDHKYESAAPNRVHLAKALAYFADAEQEPMPRMLQNLDWQDVKDFFESEARRQVSL